MDTTSLHFITSSYLYQKLKYWHQSDIMWVLVLYGTAIGTGVLFLPINAGINGVFPLLLMTMLAFPMTFFSHRGLTRFVLSCSKPNGDIIKAIEEHFEGPVGNVLILLYFFSIYSILLVYSVSITNNVENFIVQLLGFNSPPRWLLAFILLSGIMTIISFGEKYIVRVVSILVLPFIGVIVTFSLYMIPHWNSTILKTLSFSNINIDNAGNNQNIFANIWLSIPVMVFSFNHSPVISAFAIFNRKKYGKNADKKSSRILASAHLLMLSTVMFFVFSCVFTLSSTDLVKIKTANINILDYLSAYFDKPFIKYASSITAFFSIIKSFLGHYLGTREGFHGLIEQLYRIKNKKITTKNLNKVTSIFVLITTWLISSLNPNILNIIENLSGPTVIILLFIMPMYAINTIPSMRKYSHCYISNIFILVIGITSVLAAVYKVFL